MTYLFQLHISRPVVVHFYLREKLIVAMKSFQILDIIFMQLKYCLCVLLWCHQN